MSFVYCCRGYRKRINEQNTNNTSSYQRLNDIGLENYRIVEQGGGVGGTWYWNNYPGVACDVPADVYSFSWNQNKSWSGPFPGAAEIQVFNINNVKIDIKIFKNSIFSGLSCWHCGQVWHLAPHHIQHQRCRDGVAGGGGQVEDGHWGWGGHPL